VKPGIFLLAGLVVVRAVEAAPIAVTNSGFEDVSEAQTSFNEFTFGSLGGWTLHDPDLVAGSGTGPEFYVGTLTPQILAAHDAVHYQYFPNGAFEGQRVGIAFNSQGAAAGHEYGLQQTLVGTPLTAGMTYTLTVRVGNIAAGWSVNGDFFELSGFPGYRVDLMAGETVLASDTNSLAGSIAEGEWGLSSVTYTALALNPALGQDLRIRLVNLNLVDAAFPNSDREVDFDAVALDVVAVPEPGATALLIGAVLALLVAARRRF
jgi:hypothetical protein